MNKTPLVAALLVTAMLAACGKKDKVDPPAAASTAPAPTAASAPPAIPAPAPTTEPTPEQQERAAKQARLDFATMEDGYINDARGQWAQAVKASSTFGDDNGKTPSEFSVATNIAGAPDDRRWMNNRPDMGFDWIEATYAKPVAATEVRLVCSNDACARSVSKLELQDATGHWNTLWSGLNDVPLEKRGPRNWFVKTFPKTTYPVQAVKVTFANNVERGYKEVDALQLIGE